MVHFGTLYVWYTPVGTLSVLVVVLLVHQSAVWYTRIVLGHFGYDWYGRNVCVGTPVAFWYTEDRIIPTGFSYIWCSLTHFSSKNNSTHF